MISRAQLVDITAATATNLPLLPGPGASRHGDQRNRLLGPFTASRNLL
jgi:hypothetical protein